MQNLEPRRRTPTYVEAHPVLSVFQIRAAERFGNTICRFTDETGRTVGGVFICSDAPISFDYQFARPYIGNAEGALTLATNPAPTNALDPHRAQVQCPGCWTDVRTIAYRGGWACRRCLKLTYRSKLIPRLVKLRERRDELQAVVAPMMKRGRPHGMHSRTFDALVTKLEWLDEWLDGEPRQVASEEHRYRLTASWEAPPPIGPNEVYRDRLGILEWVLYTRGPPKVE